MVPEERHERVADYRFHGGIHVIRVRGSADERARAHAHLLKKEVRDGVLSALHSKNEWLIRRGPGLLRHGVVQDSIVWFYKKFLIPYLVHRNSADLAPIRAMAKIAGLSESRCFESLFQPDALMLISRLSMMRFLLKDLPAGGLPACTSAVTCGNWTSDGRLLACRNLDYPVVGPWEKHTTVIFNEPSESGALPHVAVSSAGVPVAGLTAMNAEGLTLATHAHFGREVSLRGRAIVNIADDVISRAKSLSHAVDICRKQRRIGNWSFVIASPKDKDAVAIEMSPSRTEVRHAADGFLAHTNYFQTDLQKSEALLSGAYCDDLVSRICAVRDLLSRDRGRIDAVRMARVLGDHRDPETGDERILGNIPSVVTTVQSVVFEPETRRILVSTRNESPTGIGSFVEIDTDGFWRTEAGATLEPRMFSGYQPVSRGLIQGVRSYRRAYRAWHMENDEPEYREKTLQFLRETLELYPSDGHVWVQAGIVAFVLHRFSEAQHYFETSREWNISRHVGFVRDLYLARSLDLAGRREEALSLYARYERVTEPKLRNAMLKGLRKRYHSRETSRIIVDLQFADTFHY